MANKTIVTKSINTIHALLFGISVLAFITLIIWSYFPLTVDSLGRIIIHANEAEYREALSEVESETYSPEERIKVLTSLLQSLRETKIEESLGRVKRAAYSALVTEYIAMEDYSSGLEWVEKWLRYDVNNLVAINKRIDLLEKIPGRYNDAIREVEYWYRKTPEMNSFRDKYERMKGRGEVEKNVDIDAHPPFVMYYRKEGEKFFEEYHGRDYFSNMKLDSVSKFEYGYIISASVNAVRLAFNPSRAENMYSIKRVDISYRQGETPVNLAKKGHSSLNDMNHVNGWLVVSGDAPYVEFSVDRDGRYARKITVTGNIK